MLRLLTLLLLLANGLYFAWSQGLLQAYGLAPASQREPQRWQQQIEPDALRLLNTSELKRAQAQARAEAAPKECLQAGPFNEEQVTALRHSLETTLPAGTWQLDTVLVPARWVVYMGRFATEEAMLRKRGELQSLNLTLQTPNNPELRPGIVLGRYDSREAAQAELARLAQRGIRTARVVQESVEEQKSHLKLPVVSEAMKSQINALKPALFGLAWHSCN